MLRIFIGWDSRFPEPADVLRYSLLKHSSIPLDIHYLKLARAGPQPQARSAGLDRVHLHAVPACRTCATSRARPCSWTTTCSASATSARSPSWT